MSQQRTSHRSHRTPLVSAVVALLLLTGLLTPGASSPLTSQAAAATCPCTIWSSTATPAQPSDPDGSAVELGVKFRSDVDGFVTGVRFYKGTGNTGTHTGSLWTAAGARLASATFVDETGTGWQQVLFPAPVAVTAGTTYVASYYAPNGHYAADSGTFANAGVDNAPLHALASGVDGANGIYRYGAGGGFPTNTWEAANYWVDVVFDTTAEDTTAPTVTTRSPAAGSTGAPVGTDVSATFSEPVSGASVTLQGPAGPVTGTTRYDSGTRTVVFSPGGALTANTSYAVAVSGAQDAADNVMTDDTWSFTTGSSPGTCPCTVFPSTATPTTASAADGSAVELGMRFRADTAGFVTALRFYKGPANTGTHVGHLWSATGELLSTATFSSESATGWQQVLLPAPIAVAAGTDYVASYYAPNGGYAANGQGFSAAVVRPPLRAPAHSTSTPNGVYRYGATGFPSNSFNATNYWVDVVFDTTAADRTPPSVTARSPLPEATDVDPAASVTATFNEAIARDSLTLTVKDGADAVAAGSLTYDPESLTATFAPTGLAAGKGYTASVNARDIAGNPMSAPVTWSFTTAAPPPPPASGTGPVLVVAPAATSFGDYLPEILRAEGLNGFAEGDLSALTAAGLDPYSVVVLAEAQLTAAQVTALTEWVTAGGNLIAMRPDKQLAGLLGLTAGTTTLAEGYLKVATSSGPGVGITDQTIQYHGTADRYTLSSATSVATLHSNATTATTHPAVSLRSVGTNGGQAAAFTYDLARSVVLMRQGNPAFAGLERDGANPIRSDDMFWGSSATSGWVNLNKVAIPQADEQQRLLANLLVTMNRDRTPLPRFWYFPRMAKAVVVATGDDHGNNGTAGRYDQYEANSPAGCSVVLWSCARFSSYLYPSTPLSPASAKAYHDRGFETGTHVSSGCANFTPASLESDFSSQMSSWRARYTALPTPTTTRFHCIVYSDWASQPKVALRHGSGMDTNYYYWPGSWVGNRPGFMTGSGLAMRFADTNGGVIDSYQAATQMTDESGQSYPLTPDTLLDNANGPLGYYGAFTANMHTDAATTFDSDQVLSSALSRGVPVIAARQLLTWVKGKDASTFSGSSWSDGRLTFTVTAASGTTGLMALLPTDGPSGKLTGITRAGVAVPFTTQTLKGVEYAAFSAASGGHVATYGTSPAAATSPTGSTALRTAASADTATADSAEVTSGPVKGSAKTAAAAAAAPAPAAADAPAPEISRVEVLSLPDGTATVSWRTKRGADSRVAYGRAAGALTETRSDAELVTEHSVVLTGLEPGATYHYTVRSANASGEATSSAAARFVQSAAGVADTTTASLQVGTRDAGGYLAKTGDGELQLAGDDVQDFERPELPGRWTTEPEGGGRTAVYAGKLTVEGTRANGPLVSAPRSLDVGATFTGGDQFAGLAAGVQGPWVMFAGRGGQLYASIHDGRTRTDTVLDPALVGSPHRFRIEWTASGATMFVDDEQVASRAVKATSMRPMVRDLKRDDLPLTIDWMRESAHRPASTYLSRVHDAQQMVTWDRAVWRANVPAGTALRVSVRTGSRATPDGSWTAFRPLSGPGAVIGTEGRYLQYRVELTTTAASRTPVLAAIGFTHNGTLPEHEGEVR